MIISLIPGLNAADTRTGLYLTGGFNYNITGNSASFRSFEDPSARGVPYTGGAGSGIGFGAGLQYMLGTLAGMESRYALDLGFNGFGSDFTAREHIGYLDRQGSFDPIFIDNKLSPSLGYLFLRNGLSVFILPEIPLYLRPEFTLAFPLSSAFDEKDEAVSPDDFTFGNNSRLTNERSGSIESIVSPYLAASVSLGYEYAISDNYSIVPQVRYETGLSEIAEGTGWKMTVLSLGVSLSYAFSKEYMEPKAAPLPEMPLPPAPPAPVPDTIEVVPHVYWNGREMENDERIEIDIPISESAEMYMIPPVLYYQPGSADASYYSIKLTDSSEVNPYKEIIQDLTKKMNLDTTMKVTVRAYRTDTDDPALAEKRAQSVRQDMANVLGTAPERVTSEVVVIKSETLKYAELKDEANKVELVLSTGEKLLPLYYDFKFRHHMPDNLAFTYKGDVKNNNAVSSRQVKVSLDRSYLDSAYADTLLYTMTEKEGNILFMGFAHKLIFEHAVTSDKGNTGTASFRIRIGPRYSLKERIINMVDNNGRKSKQLILGYNEFDKADLSLYNEDVIKEVREALAAGKEVEVIALTDNLGTQDHNYKLARARAEKAIRLISTKSEKLKTVFPEHPFFSNDYPYGRVLNRAVIIRISQ